MMSEVTKLFPLNLRMLAKMTGGNLLRGNPTSPILGATYGRIKYMKAGVAFFIRLSESVPNQLKAMQSQKSAVIVTSRTLSPKIPSHHAVIVVSNPYHAYWRLAKWQRAKSKAFFIGITGSAGKTTTKEMLASVLMRRYPTLKSYGNMNVFESLPSHLMRLNGRHRMAVLEMGMASFGNIRAQCSVVRPRLGIVTNVGEAHAGKLGNSLAGVVRAKQELIDGVVPGGILFLNADDKGTNKLNTSNFRGKIVRYGIEKPAHIQATNIRFHPTGMSFKVGATAYRIPSLGQHNVSNALAVIAAARELNVPEKQIQHGLQSYEMPYRRLQPVKGVRNFLLLNDTFNANPTSAIQGLRVMKRMAKKRPSVAVIGDMLALGSLTKRGHRRVGKAVAKLKADYLITVGNQSREVAKGAEGNGFPVARIRSFPNNQQAHTFIRHHIPANAVLYFKASHDIGLNHLVSALKKK